MKLFLSSTGLCLTFILLFASAYQTVPAKADPKFVVLEHIYHLPCGFEAESYEPAEMIDGMKFPMECGCSEIKGTC